MSNKKFLIIALSCFLVVLIISFVFFMLGVNNLAPSSRERIDIPRVLYDGEIAL